MQRLISWLWVHLKKKESNLKVNKKFIFVNRIRAGRCPEEAHA